MATSFPRTAARLLLCPTSSVAISPLPDTSLHIIVAYLHTSCPPSPPLFVGPHSVNFLVKPSSPLEVFPLLPRCIFRILFTLTFLPFCLPTALSTFSRYGITIIKRYAVLEAHLANASEKATKFKIDSSPAHVTLLLVFRLSRGGVFHLGVEGRHRAPHPQPRNTGPDVRVYHGQGCAGETEELFFPPMLLPYPSSPRMW